MHICVHSCVSVVSKKPIKSMSEIEFKLNKYCIKTGARKAYEKLVKAYFQSAPRNEIANELSENELTELELKIEGMKFFLENADFGYLRSTYPELNGSDNSLVKLIISDYPHNIQINCNGKIIRPEWKRI